MARRRFPIRRWPLVSTLLLTLTLLGSPLPIAFRAMALPSTPSRSPSLPDLATRFPPETLIHQVRQAASRELGLPLTQLHILRYTRETWSDSCLGLGGAAELCALMTVEGWQLEVTNGESSWFYHTDRTGEIIRRAERSDVLPPSVRDRLLQEAARQLNISMSELSVLSSEPRTWDGCLGIVTSPNQMCQEIGILGWRAVVHREVTLSSSPTWVFHLNGDATDVRLAHAATPDISEIPTKLGDDALQAWLEGQDRRSIDPAAVQQRVPTEALIAWLQAQWQRGTDPVQVQAALQSAHWQRSPEDFQRLDINGDGREEWLLSVQMDPNPMPWAKSGDFWIIGERLFYRYFEPQDYFREGTEENPIPLSRDFMLTAPQMIAREDYTGDAFPELLLQRQICGAHTCNQTYTVLRYRDGAMHSLISQAPSLMTEGMSVVMPYSELQDAVDETGDGRPDLILHGGVIGSAGAGIQRPRTEVWAWNGTAMTLADIRWDPTEYRFHVLYEANYRMAQGERDRASALYRQVIDDRALQDDLWWNTEGSVYDSSRQFAAFRLMVLAMLAGDRSQAMTWQGWLHRTYPGTPITEAARRMGELWANQMPLDVACTAAHDYLVALEPVQDELIASGGPTGPLRYMGYGNPELTGADVCPVALVRAPFQLSEVQGRAMERSSIALPCTSLN